MVSSPWALLLSLSPLHQVSSEREREREAERERERERERRRGERERERQREGMGLGWTERERERERVYPRVGVVKRVAFVETRWRRGEWE